MKAEREPLVEAPDRPAHAAARPARDLVVIGASAGGVEALVSLMSRLPADFPAAVLVVLHMMASGHSMLPEILRRAGPLEAVSASDGEPIVPARVFVAPPDHHLLVRDGAVSLNHGPLENGHRPAIDPLFRSAARAYGPRVLGVILSGLLDDGALGLRAIKEQGGATVVQDPDDALFSAMPLAAIAATEVDRVAPLADLPAALVEMVGVPVATAGDRKLDDLDRMDPPDLPDPLDPPDRLDPLERDPTALALVDGPPTPLSCPACGGALWETTEGPIIRYTCQVGHAYSQESMLNAQGAAVDSAMWSALRALEERAELLWRISRRQQRASRKRLEQRAREVEKQARDMRQVLLDRNAAGQPAES